MSRRVTGLRTAALALGFGFLYLPIALLVAYSFNASRLVAVWGGWSVHWYGALIADGKFRAAALASLEIGVMAASLSLVLGTCSGLAMARCRRFPGRLVFGFMLMAPLVVPEVILGLSLLLLFVASQTWLGWPASRGIGTVTIAHATFGSCFVAVLVRAQLAGFDRSLEEAALDLGARPGSVLWRVTLPGISPALVSGWLLAFTLSLDDLVVASFVSGPSATTLPMAVYSSVRIGVTPEINALATIFIGVVTVVVALAFLLIARQERRRLGALAIVAALCAANADAMAAGVDAARIAAIDKAAAAFAVLAKDAYRSGAPPREAEPAVGKLLGTLFDTAGLNGSSAPPFTEVDVLNDWLSRLAQVGMAYILAGTGIADPAKAGALDAQVKARIAANTVAFAPEIGRYIDADLAVTEAEIGAILAHMTQDPPLFATPKAQDKLNAMKAGLARTLAGVVTTMPTPGLDPTWPAARLAALTAIAPAAAAFLAPDDRRQLHDLAVQAADALNDEKAKAGLAAFANTIAP